MYLILNPVITFIKKKSKMKTWKDDAREGGKFHDRLIICTVKYNYFYFFLNTIELHIKNNYSMIN